MVVNRKIFCLLFLIAFVASCNALVNFRKLGGTTIPALKEARFKIGDDALEPDETSRLHETTPTIRRFATRARNGGGMYGIGTVHADVKYKTTPKDSGTPIFQAGNLESRRPTPNPSVMGIRSQVQTKSAQVYKSTFFPTFSEKSIETSTENNEKGPIAHRSKGMTDERQSVQPDVLTQISLLADTSRTVTEEGQAPNMKPKTMSPVSLVQKTVSQQNPAQVIQTNPFNPGHILIQDHKGVATLPNSNITHQSFPETMNVSHNDGNFFQAGDTVSTTLQGDGHMSSETVDSETDSNIIRNFTISSDSGCEGNCPTTISPIEESHLPSTASSGASDVSYRHRNGKLDVDDILARVSMKMNITINDSDSQASLLGSIVRKGNEGGFLIDKFHVGLNHMSKANKLEHEDINIDDKFIKMFEYDKDGRKKPFFPNAWASRVFQLMATNGLSFLKKENL